MGELLLTCSLCSGRKRRRRGVVKVDLAVEGMEEAGGRIGVDKPHWNGLGWRILYYGI